MKKNEAKAQSTSYLYKPSAKADGNNNSTKFNLICILPFTSVNGFMKYR
jgi:hypothetical protein